MHIYAQLITTFNIASPYNLSQQYMLQELEALTSDFTMDGSDFTMEGTAPAPELLAKCIQVWLAMGMADHGKPWPAMASHILSLFETIPNQ